MDHNVYLLSVCMCLRRSLKVFIGVSPLRKWNVGRKGEFLNSGLCVEVRRAVSATRSAVALPTEITSSLAYGVYML